MHIQTWCLAYRVRHKLTQAEMAERCGLTRQTIAKIERGEEVGRLTRAKVEFFLNENKEG